MRKDLKRYIADLLTVSPISVRAFSPLEKRAPKGPCNVDEVISIAKSSKFFRSADDIGYGYTIIFQSAAFRSSFGIRKDTGIIELYATWVHCGGNSDKYVSCL